MLKDLSLQLLASAIGAENSGTDDEATEAINSGEGTAPQEAGINNEEVDRIAGKRSDQASKAAIKDYFRQQGMSQQEAEQAFEQYKAAKAQQAEEERNNLSLMQQKVTELEQQGSEALRLANLRLTRAEAMIQASRLNIRPERIDYAIRLADLSEVTVDESGQVDGAAVKAALDRVVKDLPELATVSEENKPGFKLGGPGQSTGTTEDKLAEIFGNKKKG